MTKPKHNRVLRYKHLTTAQIEHDSLRGNMKTKYHTLVCLALALVATLLVTQPVNASTDKRCPQFEQLLREANLPVKTFSSIMWRESRCQPKAIGWNYHSSKSSKDCKTSPTNTYRKCKAIKSYDSGLLQINSTWTSVTAQVCKSKWGDMAVLLNAKCNIAVAQYLFNNGGLGHWSNSGHP